MTVFIRCKTCGAVTTVHLEVQFSLPNRLKDTVPCECCRQMLFIDDAEDLELCLTSVTIPSTT